MAKDNFQNFLNETQWLRHCGQTVTEEMPISDFRAAKSLRTINANETRMGGGDEVWSVWGRAHQAQRGH